MKTNTLKLLPLLLSILLSLNLYAQHQPEYNSLNKGHETKHFRCSSVMYHTYIGTETNMGKEYRVVPAIGFDAEYWFNSSWGLGMHNDLELITSSVYKGGEVLHERHTPLLLTLDGLWKPYNHFVFLFGPGVEVDEHENLFVVRGGLEYEIELKSHWDISPTIFYDSRLHAYDTFSIGIGIGKRF